MMGMQMKVAIIGNRGGEAITYSYSSCVVI